MNCRKLIAPALIVASGLVVVVSIAIAEPSKEAKTTDLPESKLPPGWTEKDMQACEMAATPGKMHKLLTERAGTWHGKSTLWMAPGADPIQSEIAFAITTIMDGRFIKCQMSGETPGVGPYTGLAIYGYDNISKEFVSTWVDNYSTGIANGIGKLSSDGKSLTWKYTVNCPMTGKPTVVKEVEKITGTDTRTLEMFSTDPKSGEEHKMMRIELTREPGARAEK